MAATNTRRRSADRLVALPNKLRASLLRIRELLAEVDAMSSAGEITREQRSTYFRLLRERIEELAAVENSAQGSRPAAESILQKGRLVCPRCRSTKVAYSDVVPRTWRTYRVVGSLVLWDSPSQEIHYDSCHGDAFFCNDCGAEFPIPDGITNDFE